MPIMKKNVSRVKAAVPVVVFILLSVVFLWGQEGATESFLEPSDSLSIDSLEIEQVAIDTVELDSVFYWADSIFYDVKNETIDLVGKAKITYHNSDIISDTITINLAKEQAFAKGKSYLQDGTQNMLGRDIYFDLDSQWGLIKRGISEFDKGFYYGEEIRKVDKRTFDVDKGLFTTCDALHPHFYIYANKLRVYQNDKIVAKPIVFYVNNFPVMALPFGTFTIKRGRQTGILVPSPGWNKVKGKYLENIAYYYAYKNFADATLYMDYFEKTGWETGFHSRYEKRYIFNGKLNAVLQKRIEGPKQSSYEWEINSTHHHDFGNKTTFDENITFISSKRVWEGSDILDERLTEKITSRLAYKRPFLNSTLNMTATYIDDFENNRKDITLPYVSYVLPSKPVYELFFSEDDEMPEDAWWQDFSYSYNFKASHVGDINDSTATFWDVLYNDTIGPDSTYATGNQHNAGIKHSASLSYSYKFKGWLNLSQSVSGNEVWFDRDMEDTKLVRGADYNTRSSLSFNLYGIRNMPAFYLSAVRHIITPSVSFTYKPDFSRNDRFYNFGGIGVGSGVKQRMINLSLSNTWQLKLKQTANTRERKINDFFKIGSSISYDFEKEGKGFTETINHSINLNPNKFAWSVIDLSTKPSGSITQETYGLKFKGWDLDKWDWAVSNWTFRVTTKLNFSGDANYIDYFPTPQNEFVTGEFFQSDTLSVEEDRMITTLEELDELYREKKNWSFNFSHTYKTNKASYEINNYTSDLRMSVSAKLTRNWSVNYDNYIDLKDDELVSHNFTITRDLHCWKVYFKYTRQGDYWSYRFQLFNIKLPEDLKFRTSDHS